MTLPTVEVATNGTTSAVAIGGITINAGAASTVTQTIGSTKTAFSIGTITAQGSGSVVVNLNPTTGATTTGTTSAQGAISASSMTSPLSSLTLNAATAIASMNITGGAGNDTIEAGLAADTITAGAGTDRIVLTAAAGAANTDTVVFSVGDSAPVVVAGNDNDTGSDTIFNFGASGADLIQVNITSADTTWDMTHIEVGTATGTILTKDWLARTLQRSTLPRLALSRLETRLILQ